MTTSRILFWRGSLALFLFPLGFASAQEKPGTVAAPILQTPLGTRAVGMGMAFTAVAQDLTSIYYNPAALATLEYTQASGMFLRGFEDQNVESVEFGTPMSFRGFVGEGYSTVAGSLLFSQNGTIEVNQLKPDGSFLDRQTRSAGGDIVVAVGYAERLLKIPFETPVRTYDVSHFAGLSAKFIHSSLAQQYSASAAAMDAGYLIQMPDQGLSFGASILNVGTKMKYLDQGDNLPLAGRAGAAYRLDGRSSKSPQSWIFALDGDYSIYEQQWHVNTGIEYSALNSVVLRGGYQFHRNVAGLTIGFGAQWNSLMLDYAWAMTSALSDTHRIGLTYRFSKLPIRSFTERRDKPYIMESEEPDPEPSPSKPSDRRSPPKERMQKPKPVPGWIY